MDGTDIDGASVLAVLAGFSASVVDTDGRPEPAVLESVHAPCETDSSLEPRRQIRSRPGERSEIRHEAEDETLGNGALSL